MFVRKWCSENLAPISETDDVSVETWLSTCPYTARRKNELLEKANELLDVSGDDRKHYEVKSFIKDEMYTDIKYPRGINSRTDEFKVMCGPIFRLIEKQVFQEPSFIKKVPVADRPQFICDRLVRDGAKYLATDFTAFESNFYKEFMQSCEMVLYDYMTPNHRNWYRMVSRSMTGVNSCSFGGEEPLKVKMEAKRMSGEMCTSLGNGFTNFILFRYFSELLNLTSSQVVEGDDGLLAIYEGNWEKLQLLYDQIGMRIEITSVDDVSSASFCGLVFDPSDCRNVTDIVDAVLEFGWGNQKYLESNANRRMALLRAKALSMAHQYPGCPVLDVLAHRVLFLTRGRDVRGILKDFNLYEREQVINALSDQKDIVKRGITVPGLSTRLLVERLFGIQVSDQLRIEQEIQQLTLGSWKIPTLDNYIPDRYKQFWDQQVAPYDPESLVHVCEYRSVVDLASSIPGVRLLGSCP